MRKISKKDLVLDILLALVVLFTIGSLLYHKYGDDNGIDEPTPVKEPAMMNDPVDVAKPGSDVPPPSAVGKVPSIEEGQPQPTPDRSSNTGEPKPQGSANSSIPIPQPTPTPTPSTEELGLPTESKDPTPTPTPYRNSTPTPTPPEDSRKSNIPTPSPYGLSDQEIIERFEKEYTVISGPSTNSPVILVFTENGITTIMIENKAVGEIDPELIELLRRYGNLMIKNN